MVKMIYLTFGSNWVEGNMGVEYQVMTKFKGVEDFVLFKRKFIKL